MRLTLDRWAQSFIDYEHIRFAEEPHPALHPSGSRLRGVKITEELIFARDRKWYRIVPGERFARLLSEKEVLAVQPLPHLRVLFHMTMRKFRQRRTFHRS